MAVATSGWIWPSQMTLGLVAGNIARGGGHSNLFGNLFQSLPADLMVNGTSPLGENSLALSAPMILNPIVSKPIEPASSALPEVPHALSHVAAASVWASLWPRDGVSSSGAGAVVGDAAPNGLSATLPASLLPSGRCPAFDELALTLSGPRSALKYEKNGGGPPRYVLIERRGGLGNQLFEIVHGVVEALASGRTPLLEPQLENPHATEAYEESILRRICLAPPALVADGGVQQDGFWDYFHLQLPEEQAAVRLAGHWVNWRYPAELPSAALRALFAPPPTLIARLEAAYGPLSACAAVHVRRGDFVTYNDFLGMDVYIEPAMRVLEARGAPLTCLLVVSDDIAWAQVQPEFIARGARFITGEGEVSSLYLLASAGRGLICPASSYCFWGAFFGRDDSSGALQRPVIMPRPWQLNPSNSTRMIHADAYYFPGVTTVVRKDDTPITMA